MVLVQISHGLLVMCNNMSTNVESPASDHRSSLLSASIEYGNRTMLSGQQQQLKLAVSCGDQVRAVTGHVNFAEDQREKSPGSSRTSGAKRHFSMSTDDKQGGFKQRRYSDRFGASSVAVNFRKRGGRGGRHYPGDRNEKFVLPTRFLLGGCITDPLNLNSLCDESVNRSMNENTPVSSPLPVPVHKLEVPVRMPTNTADPLNLNAVDVDIPEDRVTNTQSWSLFKKRRKRNRRHKKMSLVMPEPKEILPVELLHIETDSKFEDKLSRLNKDSAEAIGDLKAKRIIDHIVSPVIPQISPKWKRRRTTSESRPEVREELKVEDHEKPNLDRISLVRHKKRIVGQSQNFQTIPAKFRALNRKFCCGNYNRCVISRNVLGHYEDPRLNCFSSSMFYGKDVLDIGCNVGHMALSIAKDFYPHQVVGLDIDCQIISAAKKNLHNFASSVIAESSKFPRAFGSYYGPLSTSYIQSSTAEHQANFPCNVNFIQSDYVLKSDVEVDHQKEEFDVILALNVTKWIHLHCGDDGLKRTFRRMYRQLRPGGQLLLESQPWDTYRKKKKLTPKIYQNFKSIRFRPEEFQSYLLSPQVGFASCRYLEVPLNIRTSVKRPILVFTKMIQNHLPGSLSVSTGADELVWYRTRSRTFDEEQEQLIFPSDHVVREGKMSMNDDSASSCSWLTPQFRVGSASCSTTPCCSTYCRNTPNAEDCGHEDYATSTSFGVNNCESLPSRDDSCSCDAYKSDSPSAFGISVSTGDGHESSHVTDAPQCANETSDSTVQTSACSVTIRTDCNKSVSRTS